MRLVLLGVFSLFVIGCQRGPDSEQELPPRPQEMLVGEHVTDEGTVSQGMMGQGRMGQGMMGQGRMGQGRMGGRGMMGQGRMGGDMMRDMRVIHSLLANHEKIHREVSEIPNGVVTVTTSRDPELAALIRTHVYQMKKRVEEGRMIRRMDPLFREIFAHHDKIEMAIEEVPGGVRVRETSSDPRVALLIKQHATRAISEFVEHGMSRAMEPTPLPEGYSRGD